MTATTRRVPRDDALAGTFPCRPSSNEHWSIQGAIVRTPANIAGHPIHPMLVTIPIGLWIFSFVCDLAFVFGRGAPVWSTVALYTMAGGIVGALAAAVFGFIDLLSLPPE